jgi:hypothetical protein
MKTLIILSIATLFISINNFAQNSNSKAVWLRLESNDLLPTKVGKKLQSKDETLNTIITKNKVKSVEYVFSNSRNSELRNVVQFTCDCTVENLYADLVNKSRAVKGVEIAPVYETLVDPNDYNAVFTSDYALDLINARGAWNVTTGSTDVIIGVSDQN